MSRLYIIRKIHASFRINFTDRSYNRYLSLIVPRTSVFSRNSNFTSIQHRYNRTTGLFSRLFWACSIEIILNMVCCGSSILEWLFYIWISYNRSLRVTFRVISAHCTPFFQPTIREVKSFQTKVEICPWYILYKKIWETNRFCHLEINHEN